MMKGVLGVMANAWPSASVILSGAMVWRVPSINAGGPAAGLAAAAPPALLAAGAPPLAGGEADGFAAADADTLVRGDTAALALRLTLAGAADDGEILGEVAAVDGAAVPPQAASNATETIERSERV